MNRDGGSGNGTQEEPQAQPGSQNRVAVCAGDTYTRMRRLQTVRALGLDPRPYSRLSDLLVALSVGRHFKLILAVIDGSVEQAADDVRMLREAAPNTPLLLLRPDSDDDPGTYHALAHDFLLGPYSESDLRRQITHLLARDAAANSDEPLPVPQEADRKAGALLEETRRTKLSRKAVRPRIALLEDSPEEATAFIDLLAAHDCDVLHRRSGGDFLNMLRQESFDVLVLDWNLPGMTGLEVLREVRGGNWAQMPVLMLTARSGELETVQALESGANDFLVKPWRPYELVARIRVLARPMPVKMQQGVEVHLGFEFDVTRQTVHWHGQTLTLPAKEFNVALLLFRQAGRPLSRAHLQQAVWHGHGASGRTIDTHISRLRAKLGLTLENGFILQSIHGIGYRLEYLDLSKGSSAGPAPLTERTN